MSWLWRKAQSSFVICGEHATKWSSSSASAATLSHFYDIVLAENVRADLFNGLLNVCDVFVNCTKRLDNKYTANGFAEPSVWQHIFFGD